MNDNQLKFKFLIARSNNLYTKYLKEPFYVNALLIKQVNKKIIELLTSEGPTMGDEDSVNLILDHFMIWYLQFEELEKENFTLQEIFKFERIEQSIAYPTNEINNIISLNNH